MSAEPAPGATRNDADVVIVGAGFAGMLLAAALDRAGLTAILVDREDPAASLQPGFDGRTSAIAAASAQLLRALEIWPRLEGMAEPILEIRVSDRDAPFFLHFDHREMGPQAAPFGFIIENRDIRRALHAHLRESTKARLFSGVAVERVERGESGAALRLADGRTLRAPLVVGADGRESQLRRDAGIAATRWSYPQAAIVCTVAHELPHHGVAHERFLPAGPFAILPMTGRRSSIVWTERAELAPLLMRLDGPAFLAQLARRFGDFLGRLEDTSPRWCYPLGLLHAERYVDRRLALVGDAAHAIHPIAGQGLNLGIRDVAALAEVLVEAHRLGLDIAAPLVLERYQRWRRFDAFTLIAVTDGLNRLFSNDVAPLRLARDLGLGLVNRIAPLKRFFMRHAMGDVGEMPRLLRGEPV